MIFSISPISVIAAAFSSVIVSAIWYSPLLFATQWERLSGVDNSGDKRKREFPWLIARMFVAALLTAYVLGVTIGGLTTSDRSLSDVVCIAVLIWAGFVGSRLYVSYSFDGQPLGLILINIGNELVSLLVMALIFWII